MLGSWFQLPSSVTTWKGRLKKYVVGCPWMYQNRCYFRDANLYWTDTESAIQEAVNGKSTLISQGFIGSASNGLTTTLGREGSDYSAAIFAHALGADSVTIWKDVPGVLNGDPRKFSDTFCSSNLLPRGHRIGFLRGIGHPSQNTSATAKKGNSPLCKILW